MKDTLGGLWSYSVAGISAYMAHIGPAECWQDINRNLLQFIWDWRQVKRR